MEPQLSIIKGAQKLFQPKLLHKIFEDNIDKYEDERIALVENCSAIFSDKSSKLKTTTFYTLNATANQIANAILNIKDTSFECHQDPVIAVCMKPSDDLIITLLSIWKVGAAYLPLDATFPLHFIKHITNDTSLGLVIHDSGYENTSAFTHVKCISYEQLKKDSIYFSKSNIVAAETLAKRELTDQLAIVYYTSGSTSESRGVRLMHSNILNRLKWQFETFPFSDSEKYGVFKTALPFVDSMPEIWGPLLSGVAVVIVPKHVTQNPERLVDVLKRFEIERMVLVPSLLRSLLLYLTTCTKPFQLPNLRLVISSGETLPINLALEFFDYFPEQKHYLCNYYGSTETTGDVTYYIMDGKKQLDNFEKVPIGFVTDNNVVYLLDSDFRPIKNGLIGNLYVAGRNLADGYMRMQDDEIFSENIYAVEEEYFKIFNTGDFASFRNGLLYFEGRIDSQIKVRGNRVDACDVEKQLLAVEGIKKANVYFYKPGEWEQTILGFVTLKDPNRKMASIEIETAVAKRLPPYAIPRVILLNTFPILINGKTDKQNLLKIYENIELLDHKVTYDFTGVRERDHDVAKGLFKTISDVLGKSCRATEISIYSNFYELGGTSLNTMLTVSELQKKGFSISITAFIVAPNLKTVLMEILKNNNQPVIDQDLLRSNLKSESKMEFTTVPLLYEHFEPVVRFIASGYLDKLDLIKVIAPRVTKSNFKDWLITMWDSFIEQNLCFVVIDSQSRLCGVSLNNDLRKPPEMRLENNSLIVLMSMLEFLEAPIRDHLSKKSDTIFQSYVMATNPDLTSQENVAVIVYMEYEVIQLARKKKFSHIFTTNIIPLTHQICTELGYRVLKDFTCNEYVQYDGKKPFQDLPNSVHVFTALKSL